MADFFDVMNSLAEMAFGEDKELDFTEFDKLTEGLTNKNIECKTRPIFDGQQVLCDGWDAVIHRGSYGHEAGLLEIYGSIVKNNYDDVEGWLTADEILARV